MAHTFTHPGGGQGGGGGAGGKGGGARGGGGGIWKPTCSSMGPLSRIIY